MACSETLSRAALAAGGSRRPAAVGSVGRCSRTPGPSTTVRSRSGTIGPPEASASALTTAPTTVLHVRVCNALRFIGRLRATGYSPFRPRHLDRSSLGARGRQRHPNLRANALGARLRRGQAGDTCRYNCHAKLPLFRASRRRPGRRLPTHVALGGSQWVWQQVPGSFAASSSDSRQRWKAIPPIWARKSGSRSVSARSAAISPKTLLPLTREL
jgi:hypothetical protein